MVLGLGQGDALGGHLFLAAPSAQALAAVTTVCVGNDLYIFTSDGGTGVWYNSSRC